MSLKPVPNLGKPQSLSACRERQTFFEVKISSHVTISCCEVTTCRHFYLALFDAVPDKLLGGRRALSNIQT